MNIADSRGFDPRATTLTRWTHACGRRKALPPVLLMLLAACPAMVRAHAPPEGRSVLTDDQGVVAVIVTNRGLLIRDPTTGRSHLLCVEAIHGTPSDPPHAALLSGGRLVIGMFEGLLVSADQGCTWEPVPALGAASITAMATVPDDSKTLYIATFGADTAGVYVTHDAAATFARLRSLDDAEYISSLAVSPTDANRLYASVEDFSTGDVTLLLLRSLDGGAAWERIELEQQPTDFRMVVQAVDYQDPDSLLVSSEALDPASTPGRLLESHDAGDSFAVVFDDFNISSAGYRRSGGAWVTSGSGLFESEGSAVELTRTWDIAGLSCAGELGDDLYVCGYFPQAGRRVAGVGLRTASSRQPVAPFLLFSEVDQRVACEPATDSEELCEMPWLDWQREVLAINAAPSQAPAIGAEPAAASSPATMEPSPQQPQPMDPAVTGSALSSPAAAQGAPATSGAPVSAEPAVIPSSAASASAERADDHSNTSDCGCRASVGAAALHDRRQLGGLGYWGGLAILGWAAARRRCGRKQRRSGRT